jgi:hypothetical protein
MQQYVTNPYCFRIAHRELPMLEGWMTAADGTPGWTARFSNTEFENDAQDLLVPFWIYCR